MVKLFILALASLLSYTNAAVAIFPYSEPKPAEFADQSGCYLSSLNRVLPYNEPYYPKGDNTRQEYLCGTNNETKLFSCGAIGIPPECLEYDYTLDYPDCCGKPVCPTTTTSSTVQTSVTVTGPPCDRPAIRIPRISITGMANPTGTKVTVNPTTGNYVTVTPTTGFYVAVIPTTGTYVTVTPTTGSNMADCFKLRDSDRCS